MSRWTTHYMALLYKTSLLKAREKARTVIELTVPSLFTLLLATAYWVSANPSSSAATYTNGLTFNTTELVTNIPDFFGVHHPIFYFCQNLNITHNTSAFRLDESFVACPDTLAANLTCLDNTFADICYHRDAQTIMNDILLAINVIEGSFIPYSLSSFLALTRWVYLTHPSWDQFGDHSPRMSLFHTGFLMLVGDSNVTDPFRAFVAQHSELARRVLFPHAMTSDGAANYAYEHGAQIWAVLDLTMIDSYRYTIRMNLTATPYTFSAVDPYIGGLGARNDLMYLNSGFLTLQNFVNQYIANYIVGVPSNVVDNTPIGPPKSIAFSPMPTPAYSTNNFLQTSGQFIPLVLTFGFLYALSRLLSMVVEEKETKMKEAMLIMGLHPCAFYASWLTVALSANVVTCLLCATAGVLTFFHTVDWSLLFVLNFSFACVVSCLGFLLSTLFDRSKVAALVGPLVLFITTVPHYAVPAHSGPSLLFALSLLPCTAYTQAIEIITDRVTYNVHVGWEDIHEGDYSIAIAIGFMIIDCVLYLVTALYLELVLPGEHGVARHPLFFLPWFRSTVPPSPADSDSTNTKADIEPVVPRSDQPVRVSVQAVTKRFNNDAPPAVDRLSFDIRLDEILVLLGHNGAGKSTTMHMITGMIPPSAGDVRICGYSVNQDLARTRANIGFCPQHNVLWPSLSVRDHLVLFGIVKGNMTRPAAEAAALDMATRVDLSDQFHVQAMALSGGQKRKLSVAIALIADSPFVLLDEPTAGMDVNARRHLWNLLLTERHGRCVLLSTHYMDEADLLGDRIAIMDHGRLHTLGSSLYLKSRLGSGYTLHLVLRNASCAAAALRLVHTECPDASAIVNEVTGQMALSPKPNSFEVEAKIALPRTVMTRSSVAARVFELLEGDVAAAIGVISYGLSLTTLEDVFVAVTNDGAAAAQLENGSSLDSTELVEIGHERSEVSTACVDLTEALMEDPVPTSGEPHHRGFLRHFKAMMAKRFHCAKRDRRAVFFQVVLPIFFMAIALLLMLLKPRTPPARALDSSMYSNPSSEVLFRDNVVPDVFAFVANFGHDYVMTPVNGKPINSSADVLSGVLLRDLYNHSMDRWFAIANKDQDARLQSDLVVALHNVTAMHSIPQSLNAITSAALREVAQEDDINIVVVNHPLPMSKYEKQVIDADLLVVSALFILIPFTFIPAQFVTYVVKEREIKAKHQQWVSGASTAAYWSATVVFDLLTYLFTEALALLVFLAFHRTEFVGDAETFAATFCLFFFYGLSMVPASCLISFLFDKASVAQNTVMLANFFCGFLLVLAAQILSSMDSTRSVNETLCWIYRLVPSYCLGEGIIALSARQLSSLLTNGEPPSPFAPLQFNNKYGGFVGGVGTSLTFMGATAPCFFAALFLLERWRVAKYKLQQRATVLMRDDAADTDDADPLNEDADVREERRAVESTENGRPGDCLTLLHLTKTFDNRTPPKVAVRNVSFGVHRGEIFAFLGTNGAGKTTTMSILTGDVIQSSGRALIGPWDIAEHPDEGRQLLGYCPQFDALFPEMTAVEHMYLYCRLRGVPETSIPAVTEQLLRAMGVYTHKDKPTRDLSGGNKRKLSIAIALVGDPPVVLLDEPSAGMDPVARRSLWSSLRKVADSRSVVLTTHHLEEVEALAHRAAIMVSGSLRCVGTLQHLKSRFGGGTYEMEVCCDSEGSLKRLTAALIAAEDLEAVLLEAHGAHGHFALRAERHLSKIFKFIADVAHACGIMNFAVNQTSIEQVFLRISAENEAA